MKKLMLILTAAILLAAAGTSAFAATKTEPGVYEIDGSLGFGSGPGDFDAGVGVNFGAGMMLNSIDKNLQARIDFGYYDFSTDFLFVSMDYIRIPITISGRYYMPLNDQLKIFAQAGLESSVDSKDNVIGVFDGLPIKQTKNQVKLGLTPAAGVQFFITPDVSLFAVGSVHLIADSYFTMQFGAGFHF